MNKWTERYNVIIIVLFLALFGSLFVSGLNCKKNEKSPSTDQPILNSVSVAGVTFSWSIDGKYLNGTLESNGAGWMSVGFGGSTMATVGKIVIGSFDGTKVTVEIQAISRRSHSLSAGTILESSGIQVKGVTVITFKAGLADLGLSGKAGKEVQITLARNSYSTDINSYHGGTRGNATIVL